MDDARLGSPAQPIAMSLSAEHAWETAAGAVFPVLRPPGAVGLPLATLTSPHDAVGHLEPLVEEGPADLVVAYALLAVGFEVLTSGDHLAGWGVSPATLREAAFRNLGAWSATAPWSDETSDRRRIISSDTGDGWDASRILLPDAIAYLERELGSPGARTLVGIPSRHLLIAGALRDDDPEFASLFADFVLEYAGDSDDAIDRRVFELRGGRLAPFEPAPPA